MASWCLEGFAAICQNIPDDQFNTRIPPFIREFEGRVIREKFGTTLADWQRHERYHAYFNQGVIASNLEPDAVREEYRHWPAPTRDGRRASPVQTGDRSAAAPTLRLFSLPLFDLPKFLTGLGDVTHVVDETSGAIANVTLPDHRLHPGIIIRWVSFLAGAALSNTLGRGTGMLPSMNEAYGVQGFGNLDRRIRESLAGDR